MNQKPDTAFILAAGFGKRLRPHTLEVPKPMVSVSGRSLINRTLDHLCDFGTRRVVVNTHYLAHKIQDHLSERNEFEIKISHEPEILDTGGGIKNALGHCGFDPFFVLSGDGLWADNPLAPALETLAKSWDPEKMDILMLLQPVSSMKLTQGVGDYDLLDDGRAVRSLDQSGTYMFTSMRINHPRIFDETPDGPFSYLDLLDRAQEAGRLFGVVHQGDWHHISTPEDLARVDDAYKS